MMHHSLHAVASSEIYLYTSAVDMRRSFDGLLSIVQAEFKRDVRVGDLFVFINKRADRLKALWWDTDGLAIFMKRLESGTYQRPSAKDATGCHQTLDRVQLGLLLSGIELASVQRRKRYQPPHVPQQ
jgi:transposase